MRFIDTSDLRLPEGWKKRADQALADVRKLAPEDRGEAIKARAAIWKELRESLQALSHEKCWYCESRNIGSDNPVDHFRPKSGVKGCADHPGYWWLAFDDRNYRFSCTFCNSPRTSPDGTSGGKHDHFPLDDERHRARSPEDDLEQELPILLDPTNPVDTDALWFDDDGVAVPKGKESDEASDAVALRRARAVASIRYYHLNRQNLRELREALARRVREQVDNADKWLRRATKPDYPDKAHAHQQANYALRQVLQAIRLKSEYSATALCVLRGMGASEAAKTVLRQRP